MGKHLVFLIHGMGIHPEKWSVDTVKLLTEAYGQFPGLKSSPFETAYEFVEISYDNIFEGIRTRWGNESAALLKVMGANGLGDDFLKKLVAVGNEPSKDSFLWTHVLDVILYRFVPTVSMAVRVSVADQIMKRLNTGGEIPTWSVIAHSLGTSVAHDTLSDLYHTDIPGKIGYSLSPGDTDAEFIMMVANVSKVLETTPVYTSYLRPSVTLLPDRICRNYYSISHRRDPFTFFKPFDPLAPWPDSESASAFNALSVQHVLNWNVHDLDHYLKSPQVYIPLFRYLAGPDCITEQEETAVIQKFVDDWHKGEWAKVDAVLENVLPQQNGNWNELFASLLKYNSLSTQ